jgi:cytoskeletal protein RodZ
LGKLVNQLNSDQSAQLHSIGSFLQQRRLELGVSLEEVAAKTLIRVPLLQAIEDGDISLLPEPIYVKGLILRYGNILQVDGDTLADTFPLEITPIVSDIIAKPPAPSIAERLADISLNLKPHLGKILLAGGVVVGIVAVASLRQPFMDAIARIRPNNTTKIEASPTTPAAIVTQPSPMAATNDDSGVEATINLSADSWLQISIDGKVEFEGTLGRGTERKFVAKEKLSISAGNAGAVSVSVNREPPKPLGNPGEVKEAIFNASRQ